MSSKYDRILAARANGATAETGIKAAMTIASVYEIKRTLPVIAVFHNPNLRTSLRLRGVASLRDIFMEGRSLVETRQRSR